MEASGLRRPEADENTALRGDILEAVRDALEQFIAPALAGKSEAVTLDLILRLLTKLRSWDREEPGLYEKLRRTEDDILAAARSVVPGSRAADLKAAFTDLLGQGAGSSGAHAQEAALQTLTDLWRAEWRFRDQIDPEVRLGRASLYGGGALPRDKMASDRVEAVQPEPTITAAKLQAYLRSARWPDAQVVRFSLIPGGFAKETSRATVTAGGNTFDIVLRRDLPTGANGLSVCDEVPALRDAFAAGMAVAEPLWLETGAAFETPFLVSRAMPGSNDVSSWRGRPECVERFAEDLGRELATLHTLKPTAELMAGAEHLSTLDWIAKEFDQYAALMGDEADAPTPLLPIAFQWLRANFPDSGVTPRMLHGDVGFHNMLMQEGRITAIIDWEYIHLGDPQQELNYVRPFVDELGAWDAFIAAYQRHGGPPYRESDRRFWQAWTGVRTSIGCVGAMRAFKAGHFANPDAGLKLAVAGLNFGPRHLLYSVQEIVGAPPPN